MDNVVLFAYLAVIGWVARDAAKRGRSWYAWTRLVAFTGLLGVLWWIRARRSSPPDSASVPWWKSTLLAFSGVPIVAFMIAVPVVVTSFVVQVAKIEGQAMAPTLNDQQRVFVNKLAYLQTSPALGDIVMMRYPEQPQKFFVKRIVAGPGDTIRSENGKVYVNDVAAADDFIPEDFRSADSWGPFVINRAQYFVMGDHRNNSSDSRIWGNVPEKYIIGRIR